MLTTKTPTLALMVVTIVITLAPLPMTAQVAPQSGVSEPQPSEKPWPPAGVFRPGGDVTAPRLIKSGRPNYPGEAMRANIQGVVRLEAVVQPEGTVGEVRVTRSLDRKYGVDDAAIESLKKYRFAPGMRNGIPVPVLLSFEVSFALRK